MHNERRVRGGEAWDSTRKRSAATHDEAASGEGHDGYQPYPRSARRYIPAPVRGGRLSETFVRQDCRCRSLPRSSVENQGADHRYPKLSFGVRGLRTRFSPGREADGVCTIYEWRSI